jgi:hypothetical protein
MTAPVVQFRKVAGRGRHSSDNTLTMRLDRVELFQMWLGEISERALRIMEHGDEQEHAEARRIRIAARMMGGLLESVSRE